MNDLQNICESYDDKSINFIGTGIVFDALCQANKNNFQQLLLEVRERELNEIKEKLQVQRQGNYYAICALEAYTKHKTEFSKDEIPLLMPTMLANFSNGITTHSESEKKFYNKFKQSFLKFRNEFSDSWLKNYGYDVIADQF
jgi:hypothetical protein